jgi:hypothetical protein
MSTASRRRSRAKPRYIGCRQSRYASVTAHEAEVSNKRSPGCVSSSGLDLGAPARDIDRLTREYDEQIAAMDAELARRRRAAFIPGAPHDEPPPSSRARVRTLLLDAGPTCGRSRPQANVGTIATNRDLAIPRSGGAIEDNGATLHSVPQTRRSRPARSIHRGSSRSPPI